MIRIFLEKENYHITIIEDGQSALDYLMTNYDVQLCIFDIMLPQLDGFTLIQKVRSFSHVPIIVLTAKNMEQDKILGLDLGADDYIVKPFSSLELVSRVKAQLRRNYIMQNADSEIIRYGDLEINKNNCTVLKNGIDCSLTTMEYKLLLKLISPPERVFTKSQLYECASTNPLDGDENTVAVHISRLRDKIETNSKEPEYIKTIRGLGYKIEKR